MVGVVASKSVSQFTSLGSGRGCGCGYGCVVVVNLRGRRAADDVGAIPFLCCAMTTAVRMWQHRVHVFVHVHGHVPVCVYSHLALFLASAAVHVPSARPMLFDSSGDGDFDPEAIGVDCFCVCRSD